MPSHPFICTFSIPAWDAPFIGRRHDQPGKRDGKVCPQCASGKACAKHFLEALPGFIGGYFARKTEYAFGDPRTIRYEGWKDYCRQFIPSGLQEVRASEKRPIRLDVFCWFSCKRHVDPENARKTQCDLLFPPENGGDKWVAGYHHWPQYDAQRPQLVVIVGDRESFVGLDTAVLAEQSKLLVPRKGMLVADARFWGIERKAA